MKEIKQKLLTGERALFQSKALKITDTIFANGESPLKESENIELNGCMFKWKYPIWYAKNISLNNCSLFEMARAGIWYTNNISVASAIIEAPKGFRRCVGVALDDVTFTNASETLWSCSDVKISKVSAKGDYFAMNCENMNIDGLNLVGNYSFDGVKNVVVRNSKLLSKDAFWNSENVTVYDSFISGEYLGWNAKNLTLVNCTVESEQGMCYIENLVMDSCKLINTTLAYEYSTVQANIIGDVVSIKNPLGGRIIADSVGEIIIENDKVDSRKTTIICRNDAQIKPKLSDKRDCNILLKSTKPQVVAV